MCGCTSISINTDTHNKDTHMFNYIKQFLRSAWDYVEAVQTIRAQRQLAIWVKKEI